ncbi:ATP synthase subunit b [Pedobacter glucosidilyticus]|uniref:ATP synthase subunit b n=1 Tax=Pedobacter aquae TaxID=2605747 RepID=A0A5C0VNA2_9SPHI|nr:MULTISPECIES: F0F1 ATP synthase subunit B [Pedobacter]KHJ38658.1 ATP synthase subunit b [Pedobacter glucosidilyticus]QEK53021.1 F0F1 ATP synthase subunit B [Pedobacter aquae]
MELVTPSIGLVFWTLVSFLILLVILKKLAWKPMLSAIHERERSIEDALNKAELAKQEMARLSNENEALLKQAKLERDAILKEAKEIKDQIVNEAKTQAQTEGAKLIEKAKLEINNQKIAALDEVKNQVASLSLEIAEKIMRQQFNDKQKQEELVGELLKDVKLS